MAQEEIGKKVELAWLTAFYGAMLTDRQREVLSMHCEEDMSLAEIAAEIGTTRQGAHELLTRAADKLNDLESKLGMAARFTRMQDGLEQAVACLKHQQYDEAEKTLDALIRLDQEESNGL